MSSSWAAAVQPVMFRCNRIRMSCPLRSPLRTAQHSVSIQRPCSSTSIVNSSSSSRRRRWSMRQQGNPMSHQSSFTDRPPPPALHIPRTLQIPLMALSPLIPHNPPHIPSSTIPPPPPPPLPILLSRPIHLTPPIPRNRMLHPLQHTIHQVANFKRHTTECSVFQ